MEEEGTPPRLWGANPGKRRKNPPPADTAAHRRAAQGVRQETARRGRTPPRGRAQHPPRRQRSGEEVGQGQEDHRRRRQEGARRNPEVDGHVYGPDRHGFQNEGEGLPGDPLAPPVLQASAPRLSCLRTAAFVSEAEQKCQLTPIDGSPCACRPPAPTWGRDSTPSGSPWVCTSPAGFAGARRSPFRPAAAMPPPFRARPTT